MMLRQTTALFSPAVRFVLVICCIAYVSSIAAPTARAQRRVAARTPLPERATAQSFGVWRNYLANTPPPRVGCFTTSYPSTRWREVPCRLGPLNPESVGGSSDDFVANDSSPASHWHYGC
jgi:hypothetical protein